MARDQGARARMALAYETTYGTAPASGFVQMPFAATTLGGEAPLLASELLGYGRDPLAPQIDALNVDGTVTVPVDAAGIGYWLKGAFGDPTTSGGSTYTHVFTSGDWDLPSMAIEIAMPEVPDFTMYTGCKVDSIAFSMQRAGLLTAQVSLIAQDQDRADASAAGTVAALSMSRFGQFLGAVSRNGSALGDVVSAEFTYANNLDRIEVLRGDGLIAGADPSMAAFTGRMTVRYSSQALADQAVAGDACSLSFAWSKSASESLTILAHRVFLPRPRVEIAGPQGIQATYDFQAAQQSNGNPMVTATLVNAVASY